MHPGAPVSDEWMDMNKWMYRAVGVVGVASSALFLSNGVAHAGPAEDTQPTADREEFIGGLLGDANPLGSLTSTLSGGQGGLLGGLTGGGLTGGLTGGGQGSDLLGGLTGSLGTGGGPLSTDVIDPALRGTPLDATGQQGVQLDADLARQVNAAAAPIVQDMIADALAQRMSEPVVPESLPVVGGLPVAGSMVGPQGPLGQVVVVGGFADGLPLVGDALRGELDTSSVNRLPVVSQLLSHGVLKTSNGTGLPVVGGVPFVGGAMNNLTGPQPRTLPADAPTHVGKHRATDRPETVDPEYLDLGV